MEPNEFTRRLQREGFKALGNYLQAIFHRLDAIDKKLGIKKEEKVEEPKK